MADDGDRPRDDEVTAATDAPAFRAALEVACPGREPATVEHLGRGNRKLTRLVSFERRGSVVVQLAPTGDRAVAGGGDGTGLRAEALVLRAVRERTSVPVPAVLADGTVDGTDYLVTERADGEDLHEHFAGLDGDAQRRLARTFGRHLGAVHDAFSFAGYGPLDAVDGELEPRADEWGEWFLAYGREAVGRLPAEFDDLQGELGELLARPLPESAPPATLFPWDFRPGNALIRDGAVTAVVDWEQPRSAAPALSVAKAEYLVADWYVDDPAPLRAAFRAGYGSLRPVPDIRPGHRAVAVAASAVDTAGVVTRPSFPERDREGAVTFHRRVLERVLDGTPD